VAYTENDGVRIHYEVEGAGPNLVLLHGFMSSLEDWFECGYVAALRSNYRVILIDSRGHGGSDNPHDEASYTLDLRVKDVTSVLDALGVAEAHFWGYSMGGYIGFGLSEYAPDRLAALIIGGAHPYARDQSGHRQLLREGIQGGANAFVAAFERAMGPIPENYAAKLRAADLRAWLAGAADRIGIERVLKTLSKRCCIYCGDADPLFAQTRQASEQVPNASFFALAGLSHMQAFAQSDAILPHVLAFLADGARLPQNP
jgi:pimeloyl-ACP methyl ester carboxylesterase